MTITNEWSAGARLALIFAMAVLGLSAVPTARSATLPAPDETRTYGVDGTRAGGLDGDWLEPPLVRSWTRDFGRRVGHSVIAEDKLFVVVRPESNSYGSTLYALDRMTGETVWSKPLSGPYWLGGLAYEDGRLFVQQANGMMEAMSADTGTTLWATSVGRLYSESDAPAPRDGVLYAVGDGWTYALDQVDGTILWRSTQCCMTTDGAPAVDHGKAYVVGACPHVYALDRDDGHEVWGYHPGCSGGGGATPVVHGGRLYDPYSGWVFDAQTGATVDSFASSYAPPVFRDSAVLYSSAGTLSAERSATGTPMWSFKGDGSLVYQAVAVGDDVFAMSDTGAVFGLDLESGAQTWSGTAEEDYTGTYDSGPQTAPSAGQGTLAIPLRADLTTFRRPGPDTAIDLEPTRYEPSAAALFTFRSPGAVRFECRLDAAAWVPCSSPQAYAALPDGEHSFEVRGFAADGTADPAPAQRLFLVDTDEPGTTIDSAPPAETDSTTAKFTYHSDESNTRFECRLDAGPWAGCNRRSTTYTNLAPGQHVFEVRAEDRAGNDDLTAAQHVWKVDRTPPDTVIASGPDSTSASEKATFEFSASEAGSVFRCRLDGGVEGPCESPRTYLGLADGPHRFEVAAIDRAGNRDPSPAVYEWTVDADDPDTAITAAPPESTTSRSATFAFESNEHGNDFDCRLDDGGWVSCSSPRTYSGLANGSHTFSVRAVNRSTGRVDESPVTRTWTVTASDSTAPDTAITRSPGSSTTTTSATFEFESTEAGSVFDCRLDSSLWEACASPVSYDGLSPAVHVFEVRATDAAGNADPTPAARTWTIEAKQSDPATGSGGGGPPAGNDPPAGGDPFAGPPPGGDPSGSPPGGGTQPGPVSDPVTALELDAPTSYPRARALARGVPLKLDALPAGVTLKAELLVPANGAKGALLIGRTRVRDSKSGKLALRVPVSARRLPGGRKVKLTLRLLAVARSGASVELTRSVTLRR